MVLMCFNKNNQLPFGGVFVHRFALDPIFIDYELKQSTFKDAFSNSYLTLGQVR